MKKKLITLIIAIIVIAFITASAGMAFSIEGPWMRGTAVSLINLCNGAVAAIAMKITGMKLDIDFKNIRQYIIGTAIAFGLSISIAVIPALCGCSLVGGHTDFNARSVASQLAFYMFVIGPVEELVSRAYIQDTLVSIMPKCGWLAVILASALFGAWHLINGSPIQVLFAFGIGCVFGFSRYLIKDFKYLGLSFSHGLYDFLNEIVRIFIV